MAVVPKTMELGCQASLMECKGLAADVILHFPEKVTGIFKNLLT